ncbi:MAG: FGGY-family carbohydrate kinase [Nitrospiraceae bacterium]|nr:FGGY-family carbohydrate kinase [Nitrospiraceae bacterium]
MSRDYLIGVDCSTTAAKAVVWTFDGIPVSQHKVSIPLSQPRPNWVEQNAEDWWSATASAIQRAAQTVDTSRLAALSITHQRETFVCLDGAGQPLRPAMLWMDSRAITEVEKYGSDEVHRITGKPPNPTPAWYKLVWLAHHEREILARTAKVVDVEGFLVFRLTGQWATSLASADPLGLVDMTTADYHDGLLDEACLTREQLCPLLPPGSVVGSISDEVASGLGLPPGLPVIAGAGDGQCAQIGSGITQPGRAYMNLGTGVVSGTFSEKYLYGREYRTLFSAKHGGYTLETFIGGGTHNLNWLVEKLSGIDSRTLALGLTAEQVLDTAAAQIPPGADGLLALPYWTGALTPYWDHHARGVLIGLTGVHGQAHIYRALLESIAFEQRFLTDGADCTLDVPVQSMVALGGGSRSRLWCQIIADVTQRPIDVVREPESTSLGAAILAAVAVGVYGTTDEATAAMTGTGAHFEPDPPVSAKYEALYSVYRDIYPSVQTLFPRIVSASSL